MWAGSLLGDSPPARAVQLVAPLVQEQTAPAKLTHTEVCDMSKCIFCFSSLATCVCEAVDSNWTDARELDHVREEVA